MGEYGDYMGTLQQTSALVVGKMWGLRFLNAPDTPAPTYAYAVKGQRVVFC